MEFVIKTFRDFECNWMKRSRMDGSLCAYEFMWASVEKSYTTDWSDDSLKLSSSIVIIFYLGRIHKACIAPVNRATYYVFIKRKHIQTLIFKWIFKRTYNHIHFRCAPIYFRLAIFSIWLASLWLKQESCWWRARERCRQRVLQSKLKGGRKRGKKNIQPANDSRSHSPHHTQNER